MAVKDDRPTSKLCSAMAAVAPRRCMARYVASANYTTCSRWKLHDGEAYKCVRCYLKSPDPMPEGYEDCKSVAEIRERSKELGHVNQRK